VGVLLDVRHSAIAAGGVCHGPGETPCPLLEGCSCADFERATGVVFGLDLDVDLNRAVLARYRQLRPDLPIHVITSPETAQRWAAELEGTTVVTREEDVAALVDRLEPCGAVGSAGIEPATKGL